MKTINNGVYPTMVTPFTADNKVDYDGVKALTAWYAKKGVDGIFAICQSSEIFYLSFEERLELLKFIMANKPEGMSVVASGHTSDDLEVQIKEARAFIETGIDAYVFISNRFAAADEDDDILFERMEYVANALPDVAFGVYECPYPYKRELTPYILKKMAESGKYTFIKDTCCNLDKIKAKLDAVKGSPIKLYNANSATLLQSLRLGCDGFSGVMANFHPDFYSALIKANEEGNNERAEELQNIVGFFSVAECQCYPVNAKYYLGLDGLNITYNARTRSADELTPSRKLEIEQMYALTKKLEEQYNI